MITRRNLAIGLAGSLAIAVVVAGIVALGLPGDGEVGTSASVSATPLGTRFASAQLTTTPVAPTVTATTAPATAPPVPPTSTPTVEPTALPDRTNCDEIRGTAYRSEQERALFFANCIPTPSPTTAAVQGPPAESASPAGAPVSVSATIGGTWLLYDGVGLNAIEFDAAGKVTMFSPPQPELAGSGSLSGNTMTFTATGFSNPAGQAYSVSYTGRRLSESELAGFALPFDLDASQAIAFFGDYTRSDMQGIPVSVLAIKATD